MNSLQDQLDMNGKMMFQTFEQRYYHKLVEIQFTVDISHIALDIDAVDRSLEHLVSSRSAPQDQPTFLCLRLIFLREPEVGGWRVVVCGFWSVAGRSS